MGGEDFAYYLEKVPGLFFGWDVGMKVKGLFTRPQQSVRCG
jgi:hypothetical protein